MNSGAEEGRAGVQAVIVVPPYFPHTSPSLASGILKAGLDGRGIKSNVMYANILFVQTVGLNLYERILENAFEDLLFECLFARFAHRDMKDVDLKQIHNRMVPKHLSRFYEIAGHAHEGLSDHNLAVITERCGIFIEETANKIARLRPMIVGFSSTLQQTNSSAAIAKAVRRISPGTICVIGGNNCDSEMGEELSSSFKEFDYVFQGEADFAFADFCHNYIKSNVLPADKLVRCAATPDLDSLPVPDHSDFFEQSIVPAENVMLGFESSRGCWWGHKKQCKFCGESYLDTRYRYKSPGRILNELNKMQNDHPDTHRFCATDSIFPSFYFRGLLSELARSGFRKRMVYQCRTNLTSVQIAAMKAAGIDYVFPGIESLSTRLLGKMNKGTDALMNISFLRNCRELDVWVNWLLLVGIPGDRAADYEEQSRLLPLIQHLFPPVMNPLRIHRFSPYFIHPEADAIRDIRPVNAYTYAFPGSVDTGRIAYYFDSEYPSESRERPEVLLPVRRTLDKWLKKWGQADLPVLTVEHSGRDTWTVKDSRDCSRVPVLDLSEKEYLSLKQCRAGTLPEEVGDKECAGRLLDLGYLIEADGKLLSVVCDLSTQEIRGGQS